MKQNLIKKPCPTCGTPIGIGIFSNREEIIRCPKCGELLIENPKRKQIGSVIAFLGILIWIALNYWTGISLNWLFLIVPVLITIFFLISSLTVVKKDLVIKNKQTNHVSYVDKQDWDEILTNSSENGNNFEIVEELK